MADVSCPKNGCRLNNTSFKDTWSFCVECGTKLVLAPLCKCGKPIEKFPFCPYCGRPTK